MTLACLLLAMIPAPAGAGIDDVASDTLRLRVGSPEVDGRIFPTHLARNRIYIGDGSPPVTTWTNELTVGDSAGVPVHRWVTRGVRLGPGLVITAPVWSPGMEATETRVFSVIGRETVRVEDADVQAWKVEEHVDRGRHVATWYLTDASPYMVLAEMTLPDGRRQRITGVALDGSGGG